MAIIIDTNCFANVFSTSSLKHEEFKPVLDWILKGKGVIVFGGSKYKAELKNASRYLKIINLLKDSGKVHIGCDKKIDDYEKSVREKNTDPDFDDQHIPAIVAITKCKLICSEDTRSIKHVTNKKYYPKTISIPIYYTSSNNKTILNDKNIHDDYKPLSKINKEKVLRVESLIKQIK